MEQLRDKFEQLCQGVAHAVNAAPAGQVINASEEKVRDLLAAFRRTTYHTAVQLPLDWGHRGCLAHAEDGQETVKTRVYLGSDGVKVPLLTQAEKNARRVKIKAKRRRCGKKCRPVPRPRSGADQRYKEFKIVTY